jgi:hypothetical protein
MSEFTPLVCIEQHGDGDCDAATVIQWVCETGKAGRFVHFIDCGHTNWELCCALEDGLIETRQNEGWTFVAGRLAGDKETTGWLTYQDWVVLPYGPERKKSGSDIGIWHESEFEYEAVYATAPAADDSGIVINAQLRLMEQIDAIELGEM